MKEKTIFQKSIHFLAQNNSNLNKIAPLHFTQSKTLKLTMT